jgi:hypothetical protein
MNEFLIQKETLTNIADKFRDYLYEVGNNTHDIDAQFKGEWADELVEGAVNFTFYEEFDAAGYPADQGTYVDGSVAGGFLRCGMRRNNKGHLVPVIISEDMYETQEQDYSAYYYVGIDVVEGVTYDKWRRIEGIDTSTGGAPNPDENYMWESPFKCYVYTNRIVVPVSENVATYSPVDFPNQIEEVYKQGLADGDKTGNYSQGLEYTLSDDGTYYTVSSKGTCKDAEVVIPAVYNGKPVTTIGQYAFSGSPWITRVTLPNSINTIVAAAFSSCTALAMINIPKGVTSMGYWAFYGCTSLTVYYEGESQPSSGWNAYWNPDSRPVIYNCIFLSSEAFETIEALGVLCEWNTVITSDNFYSVAIRNLHPSYYLHCDIAYSTTEEEPNFVVAPNSTRTWESGGAAVQDEYLTVKNVRWTSSAT